MPETDELKTRSESADSEAESTKTLEHQDRRKGRRYSNDITYSIVIPAYNEAFLGTSNWRQCESA
jgi:hypothetical protein